LKATPIYVETFIKATLDQVWAYTQNPEKHQIWDLRFSEIKYLLMLNRTVRKNENESGC
jgi:hypothetical protein